MACQPQDTHTKHVYNDSNKMDADKNSRFTE